MLEKFFVESNPLESLHTLLTSYTLFMPPKPLNNIYLERVFYPLKIIAYIDISLCIV